MGFNSTDVRKLVFKVQAGNVIDADTYDAYSSGDVGAGVPAIQYKLNNNHVEVSFTGMNSGTVTDNRPAFIYIYNTLELDAEL